MSPQVERPLPPYMQITQHFRDRIKSGELAEGDRLPSARQLVQEWGVAHATAAKVLATLRAEGLVTTTPGGAGGTVVSRQGLKNAPRDRMLAVQRWGKIYPADEHARITAAELIEAPDHIAEALGLPPQSQVIRRSRITYRGDTPVSASTSWFDGALAERAPALLLTERLPQGTPGYIAQQTGRSMAHGRDQVAAGVADHEQAARLGIPEGSPVMLGRNWVLDPAGGVIEYGESCAAVGRWSTYEYDLA